MLVRGRRKISEEIYLRNKDRAYMSDEDMEQVFSQAELCGYGVYLPRVYAGDDGKYYVEYETGSSCD